MNECQKYEYFKYQCCNIKMDVIRFKHSRNAGDLIVSMAGMAQIWADTGRKAVIIQRLGLEAFYYEGAIHPIKNERGVNVCMDEKMWQMLLPLLESQPYVDHCEVYSGQLVDIDLDRVMHDKQIPMPGGDMHFWNNFIVPEMAGPLDKNWIYPNTSSFRKEIYQDCIIVNKTERYNNPHITYHFLKQYEINVIFAGTKDEHEKFQKDYGLKIGHIVVNSFLELAQSIASCKLFIGCQSFCWHLADAMHVPRILEYCPQFPNTHPTGANGYAFIHQQALELYVHKLFNS